MTLGTSGASITLEVAEDGTCSVATSQGVASYSTAFDGTLESVTARCCISLCFVKNGLDFSD